MSRVIFLGIEYGKLQFQAQDLGDEFKLSRGFFGGVLLH
jgi:hypothetical protein